MLKDEPLYWCSRCEKVCYNRILPAGWENILVGGRDGEFDRYALLCPDCAKKEREDARKATETGR